MTTVMAAYGNRRANADFDLHTFAKAFVAGLVSRDLMAVRPHSPNYRRGFAGVLEILDKKIRKLERSKADQKLLRQLIRVANDLRPSNSGGYEGFETALRSLQLTFATCPNPFYEEITFALTKPYAEATVKNLPDFHRKLVDEAAEIFVREVGA